MRISDWSSDVCSSDLTDDFHARLRAACAPFGPDVYERYAKWADDYFYIPHRSVHRGVGGIFYDHLECRDDAAFERQFEFTHAVGEAFLDIFPQIVRRRLAMPFPDAERENGRASCRERVCQ